MRVLFLLLFVSLAGCARVEPDVYLIPDGYVGWVWIQFDEPAGEEARLEGKTALKRGRGSFKYEAHLISASKVTEVPASGYVRVRHPNPRPVYKGLVGIERRYPTRFFYHDSTGNREELFVGSSHPIDPPLALTFSDPAVYYLASLNYDALSPETKPFSLFFVGPLDRLAEHPMPDSIAAHYEFL